MNRRGVPCRNPHIHHRLSRVTQRKQNTDMVQTGYKYRLVPMSHHLRRLTAQGGDCRYVYNYFLRYREDAHLAYKCARSGAKLIFKHPAQTSQECAECHHTDSANRPSQAVFACVACGHKDNADHNAARVILTRPALPPDRRGAARGGKRIRAAKAAHRPNETRTQLRDQAAATPPGSTRIPTKVAQAA